MARSRNQTILHFPLVFAVAFTLAASATELSRADDVFTATNPATGRTESVWSGTTTSGPAEVLFSVLTNSGWSSSEQLTSNSIPDLNPHLAFDTQGNRYVVWWSDESVDSVWLSSNPASGGGWSSPALISDGIENARSPRVALDSGEVYIVFEGFPTSGNRKVIVGKTEAPTWPADRTLIATASQSTPIAVRIHTDSGHLWVDWVDSSSRLGWSQLVNGAWTSASYENYSGSGDIDAGRLRIRATIDGS